MSGEGVGIVVLKRLSDALADGDPICAVIRGSAINNDGSLKVGYTAPSVAGQAEVIAMAQAALPRLQDERLREIANAVIETQGAEIAHLQEYREAWYGDPNSMPMDEAMMAAMEQMMPGMGDMEAMAAMMDSDALVAAFCAAENGDLTFIDLTIPHHEMAIAASEAALEQATHPEIKEVAQQVIEAQEREITELTEIRQRLAESARPSA